ncbi:hypothetical protein AiwAL_19385 [Acidiphilium sp. AL]|uniref:hypothetical protein n=1 Tax=Acidiphilium sp. AL TaxID=2871704 RepID=UPI0021CB62CC|nr:hypothetical protein [Acidiphilium sp. AL]MCU4162212.1 hypothetical protein [Acidiphilium sp. AL]
MCKIAPEQLEREIRSLVVAQSTNLGIEIELPLVYPSGESVRVFVTHDGAGCVIHDAGFGAMSFAAYGGKTSKSAAQKLSAVAAKYGCDFKNDRVSRLCAEDQVAIACVVVANVSRAIADQALDIRRHPENEFREVVADMLKRVIGRRLRSNEQVYGASGRSYRIPHLILDQNEEKPIAYIMPVVNRNAILPSFAELFDIKKASPMVLNDVVYDDQSDIRDEDRKLLADATDQVIPFVNASRHFEKNVYA